jgi:hypothetical protein
MKALIFTLISLTATLAIATAAKDTSTEFLVEGVHCSSCTKMISKKVCADEKLAASFDSCGVTVVDEKKQIGKISLRLKEGKTLDTAALNTAIAAAGPQFKIQIPAEKK